MSPAALATMQADGVVARWRKGCCCGDREPVRFLEITGRPAALGLVPVATICPQCYSRDRLGDSAPFTFGRISDDVRQRLDAALRAAWGAPPRVSLRRQAHQRRTRADRRRQATAQGLPAVDPTGPAAQVYHALYDEPFPAGWRVEWVRSIAGGYTGEVNHRARRIQLSFRAAQTRPPVSSLVELLVMMRARGAGQKERAPWVAEARARLGLTETPVKEALGA